MLDSEQHNGFLLGRKTSCGASEAVSTYIPKLKLRKRYLFLNVFPNDSIDEPFFPKQGNHILTFSCDAAESIDVDSARPSSFQIEDICNKPPKSTTSPRYYAFP